MPFPRSRSDVGTSIPIWGRWRRNRNSESGAPRRENPEDSRHRFHQRMSWLIGGFLILVIVAVLAAGYKDKFWDPPRAEAGSVRGVTFSMGDLVRRIRVVQGITGTADLTTLPFEYLQRLLHAEILRQDAASLNIGVTDEIIESAMRNQHSPRTQPGQTTDPGQLEQEYENNLQIYLNRTGLSKSEYRGIVEETLQRQFRYLQLSAEIEDSLEQVEVEWIRLEVNGQVTAADVMTRLENETFSAVAQSVGVSAGYADNSGYVGWVPRLAFEDIAPVLFGDEQRGQKPLDVGAVSSPLFTGDGIYIVHKLSGPETREVTNVMRARVNNQLLEDWEQQRLRQGTSEKWASMIFNSDLYKWVADQVAISAPRNQSGGIGNQSGGIGNQPAQR